jgi:hypothetical protein
MLDNGACNWTDLQKGDDAYKQAWLEYDPTGQKQKRNREIAETILYDGTELLTSLIFDPADWAFTIRDCVHGKCSYLAIGFMVLPGLSGKSGHIADDAIQAFWRKEFTRYPNGPYAIFGRTADNYQDVGLAMEGSFLWSPRYNEYREKFGLTSFWENINKPFIQDIINKKKDVYLATPLMEILLKPDSFAF